MENLIAYLKEIGVSSADIETLKKKDLPEGFDIKARASEFIELKSKIDADVKKKIEQDILKTQIPIFKTGILQKVNKKFGFGLSRSDIEKMEDDEFLTKGFEAIEQKISESSRSGDDELKKQIKEKENELVDLREQIETIKTEKDQAIKDAQKEYANKEYQFNARRAFDRIAAKYELSAGLSTQAKQRLNNDYFAEVLKYAKIVFADEINDANGKPTYRITDLEGGDVTNFDKNGKWKTLDDIVHAIYQRDGVLKTSNGGQGGDDGTIIKNLGQWKATDKTSDRLRQKIQRLEQAEASRK